MQTTPPTTILLAMRDAFVAAKHKTLVMQIGIVRAARRIDVLEDPTMQEALLDCIVASVAPLLSAPPPRKQQINWETAQFVVNANGEEEDAADIDRWVELSLQEECSDDLLRWLVETVGATVTDRALEHACRADRWRTALPILLSSKNIETDNGDCTVVLSGDDAVLDPGEMLTQIPQMFKEKNYQLKLGPVPWALTAAVNYPTPLADLRPILEPMLHRGVTRWTAATGQPVIRISVLVEVPHPIDEATALHVGWMNSTLMENVRHCRPVILV